MKKIGARKIWFTGSRRYFERIVWQDEEGALWCVWYGERVQVKQADGYAEITGGWSTVEEY